MNHLHNAHVRALCVDALRIARAMDQLIDLNMSHVSGPMTYQEQMLLLIQTSTKVSVVDYRNRLYRYVMP